MLEIKKQSFMTLKCSWLLHLEFEIFLFTHIREDSTFISTSDM